MNIKKYIVVTVVLLILVCAGSYYMFLQMPKQITVTPMAALTPGVTDTEILIGSSAALSGTTGSLGLNLISGAKIAIQEINDAGGINGRKLRMISYDDKYEPSQAIENTQKLINDDKVFALSNYVGTPTGIKVMPLVEEARVPLVGMFTGAHAFREPLQKYIFNIRGSYYQETEMAVTYFVDNLNLKNVAVLYQADAFGLDGLEGVKIALNKRGLSPTVLGSYERATTNVEEAVNVITGSNAGVVIMIGTYAPLAKFVALVKEKKPSMLFNSVSFVGSEAFAKELKGSTDNVFITQVVPPTYYGSLFDGVKGYMDGISKYSPNSEESFGGLEGYINTKVLAEGLRLAGRNLTQEGLVTALESIVNYDAGIGVNVSFSPTNHQGLNKVYLTKFDKDAFVLIPVK